MTNTPRVAVVIPALNEAASIGRVLADLPRPPVTQVVVVDNGSTDNTADVARKGGAMVLLESRRGYGQACLTGIVWLSTPERRPDILVFIDGDYSDHPSELTRVLAPIVAGRADLVIGSRVLGESEPGALLPQARFGNWLATRLIRLFWGVSYTDLGPFRAIAFPALLKLQMADTNYGWTVEMQVKAAQQGLAAEEVPVSYRKRIGISKVTGTIKGSVGAGTKILWTIFREALKPRIR